LDLCIFITDFLREQEQIFYLVGIANLRLKDASEKKEMCHLEFCYVSTIFFLDERSRVAGLQQTSISDKYIFFKKDQLYVPYQ